jgi:8-oxo-dGTP diphosphatase
MDRPKVGVGVLVLKDKKILMGLRKSKHGLGTWCPPGGHLEGGESWEECAIRETKEETGIEIQNIRLGYVTNDIHENEGKHYITLIMLSDWKSGNPQILEPDKCEKWEWVEWDNLPSPLFLPIKNAKKQGYNPLEDK